MIGFFMNKYYTHFYLYLRVFYYRYEPLESLNRQFLDTLSLTYLLRQVLRYLELHHNTKFYTEDEWRYYLLNIKHQQFLYFIIHIIEQELECYHFAVNPNLSVLEQTDIKWFL